MPCRRHREAASSRLQAAGTWRYEEVATPAAVDWRAKNAVSEVGRCGGREAGASGEEARGRRMAGASGGLVCVAAVWEHGRLG